MITGFFLFLKGTKLGAWVAGKMVWIVLALLLVAGLYAGFQVVKSGIETKAIAKQQEQILQDRIATLEQNVKNLAESQEVTKQSVAELSLKKAQVVTVIQKQTTATNTRVDEISKDITLTDKQKKEQISLSYAESMWDTYCSFSTSTCVKLVDKAATAKPAKSNSLLKLRP